MAGKKGIEGIWFLVLLPGGWELITFPLDDPRWPDGPTHPDCWPVVANEVAEAWSAKRGIAPAVLRERIGDCPYAFPRGRVSRNWEGRLTSYFGEESPVDSTVREKIRKYFAGSETLHWKLDSHEHCLAFERDEVCGALGIAPGWDAQ